MDIGGLFTRQERMALGFLVGAGLVGMGIHWVGLERPPAARFAPPAAVAVNRADAPELAALPGIGPVLAERIVKERLGGGRFLTLTDLSRVKGVTPKVLEKLRGRVRFD